MCYMSLKGVALTVRVSRGWVSNNAHYLELPKVFWGGGCQISLPI